MRTTAGDGTVRLYHLGDDGGDGGGVAETLMYGPLDAVLRLAAEQPEGVQASLFIQTPDDVIGYLDLIGG